MVAMTDKKESAFDFNPKEAIERARNKRRVQNAGQSILDLIERDDKDAAEKVAFELSPAQVAELLDHAQDFLAIMHRADDRVARTRKDQ
jgi:hypothetical protein